MLENNCYFESTRASAHAEICKEKSRIIIKTKQIIFFNLWMKFFYLQNIIKKTFVLRYLDDKLQLIPLQLNQITLQIKFVMVYEVLKCKVLCQVCVVI